MLMHRIHILKTGKTKRVMGQYSIIKVITDIDQHSTPNIHPCLSTCILLLYMEYIGGEHLFLGYTQHRHTWHIRTRRNMKHPDELMAVLGRIFHSFSYFFLYFFGSFYKNLKQKYTLLPVLIIYMILSNCH